MFCEWCWPQRALTLRGTARVCMCVCSCSCAQHTFMPGVNLASGRRFGSPSASP
jgi:hypothetical protein